MTASEWTELPPITEHVPKVLSFELRVHLAFNGVYIANLNYIYFLSNSTTFTVSTSLKDSSAKFVIYLWCV